MRDREQQSRALSALEAATNLIVGWVVSVVLTVWTFPLMGYPVTASEAAAVSMIFTGASLVRSYAVRRGFERLQAGGG